MFKRAFLSKSTDELATKSRWLTENPFKGSPPVHNVRIVILYQNALSIEPQIGQTSQRDRLTKGIDPKSNLQ